LLILSAEGKMNRTIVSKDETNPHGPKRSLNCRF
jgi:hypothetical protein